MRTGSSPLPNSVACVCPRPAPRSSIRPVWKPPAPSPVPCPGSALPRTPGRRWSRAIWRCSRNWTGTLPSTTSCWGGGRPSIGDYGLIGPLYAHLYRDPASGRLMREKAPQVAAWVERMIDPPAAGGFLPDDELPPTLLPVLQRMFTEQVPVLQETARQLQQWADANPDTPEIP